VGTLPRTWNEQCQLLQMAFQIWWHGCVADLAHEGAGRGKQTPEENVCREEHAGRLIEGSTWKKVVRPSQRKEMAQWAVQHRSISIRLSCRTFSISETCYRYHPKLGDENERIADHLLALTKAKKMWGFGLCYLYLRNVKGFGWNVTRQGIAQQCTRGTQTRLSHLS